MRKLVSVLALSVQLFAQTSPDTGEQRAIDQLRAIVESIKTCKVPQFLPGPDLQGFTDIAGPIQNVVWNVELHPSIRGRYIGAVEFSKPSAFEPPLEDSICTKKAGHVAYCRHIWEISMQIYERQIAHPERFRYEFDVTDHGLQFLDSFKKIKQTDDEPWLDGDINSDFCASKAIKSILNGSGTPQSVRPQNISYEIWTKANQGDSDAQSVIGDMYAEGISVPQDYAEAYFWLDLSASGKPQIMTRDDVAKLRDNMASHLTEPVLLQTQQRAKIWTEEHSTK